MQESSTSRKVSECYTAETYYFWIKTKEELESDQEYGEADAGDPHHLASFGNSLNTLLARNLETGRIVVRGRDLLHCVDTYIRRCSSAILAAGLSSKSEGD